MSKKRTTPVAPPPDEPAPEKVVIYLEVDPSLKSVMERLARMHNRRLTGECIQALQEYATKYDAWPPAGTSAN